MRRARMKPRFPANLAEERENRLRVRIRLREDRGSDLHQNLQLGELRGCLPDIEIANRRFGGLQIDCSDAIVVGILIEPYDDRTQKRLLVEQRVQGDIDLTDRILGTNRRIIRS